MAACAAAFAQSPQASLQRRVEDVLQAAGPGTRFGLLVSTEDGREIVAINPDQRFMPGSNTKVFTTATVFATLPSIDQPDADGGAAARLDPRSGSAPDVVLEGHGDARLSSAGDCMVDCLSTLADAVAARTRVVHDVVGDDSHFPDERWSSGMSWNNIPTRSGTAISALTIDDNELALTVTPGTIGKPPRVDSFGYYTLDNRAVTAAAGTTAIDFDRAPNDRLLHLSGTIAADAKPAPVRVGIDDPAHFAAWRLKAMLEARGVRVTGTVSARHRLRAASDDPAARHGAPAARPPQQSVLAKLVPPPLAEDLLHTNKVSQNLHAELMLRRVGAVTGTGSVADGLAVERLVIEGAGVPHAAFDLADGSGMSTYDRVAPRGMVTLLRWIATQAWGGTFRATLPIAGIDGTLASRFRGSPLQGKVFAKTGSLNATAGLSGYMIAKSGRTLVFASYANDFPDGAAVTKTVEHALELVANEN